LRLHQGFSQLDTDLAQLNQYQEDGEVLPLIDGTGELLGNFVIRRMEESPEIHGPTGRAISVILKVELTEYVGEIVEPAQGFASSPDRVIPLRLVRVPTTVTAAIVSETTSAELSAAAAFEDVQRSAPTASERPALFARASSRVEQSRVKITDAIDKVQNFNSIAQQAPNMLSALQTVLANIEVFATAVASGDLTNALSTGENLNESLSVTQAARAPLIRKIILRQ